MDNIVYGKVGETLATNYLKNNGYKIIKNNYKNVLGEIDIIAYDTKTNYIVFVEVKHRTSSKFGMPMEAVGIKKQNKIRNVATLYLKMTKSLDKDVRFDVIDILDNEVSHIVNAF